MGEKESDVQREKERERERGGGAVRESDREAELMRNRENKRKIFLSLFNLCGIIQRNLIKIAKENDNDFLITFSTE